MLTNVKAAYEYAKDWAGKGKVADYIPELAKGDGKHLAVCVTDLEGLHYGIGDLEEKFTIQSISKVIILAAAIQDSGFDKVFERVGMEPTGDPFNSIVRLETMTEKPLNPMINAGAIATATCIRGEGVEERFEKVRSLACRMLGNSDVEVDQEVYHSELVTGDRNRALAYMMRSNGVFDGSVSEHLKLYFRCCSLQADCREISYMGAVLANDGITPESGERVLEPMTVRVIRSLMATCGMYDASGEFMLKVGIPSKSGVGGGIVSAVPGKMGIGVFSPALDQRGNSMAGYRALEYLSEHLKLSVF